MQLINAGVVELLYEQTVSWVEQYLMIASNSEISDGDDLNGHGS